MSQTYGPPGTPTTRTAAGLLVAWGLLTLVTGGFVLRYGHDAPWQDEWEFVPALAGERALVPWLWEQHNEHRVPLPRLVYLVFYRLTLDYRTGMVLSLAVISLLALGHMRLVAFVRGRPAWTDAFCPLVLLNLGHAENWLWGDQFCFALLGPFLFGLLVAATKWTPTHTLRPSLLAAGCFLGLLACGASAFPYLPPVAVWFLVLAVRSNCRRTRLVLVGTVAVSIAFLGVYLIGYERPSHHPPLGLSNPGRILRLSAQVLSTGWGIGTAPVWPVAAVAAVAAAVVSGGLLIPREIDTKALGYLAVLVGTLGLALMIGVGRAGFASDEMGLASRYGWLAAPVVLVAYLSTARGDSRFGRRTGTVLFAIASAAYPLNVAAGFTRATGQDEWQTAVATDLRAGIPLEDVIDSLFRGTGQEERARAGIPLLQREGLSEYAERPRSRFGLFLGLLAVAGAIAGLVRFGRKSPASAASRFRANAAANAETYRGFVMADGAPHGLNWLSCSIVGDPVFASDRSTGCFTALTALIVDVEPAPGADMDDVPAARVPRTVTALFAFNRGGWKPTGRPLFNLSPAEVVARSNGRFVPVEPPPPTGGGPG